MSFVAVGVAVGVAGLGLGIYGATSSASQANKNRQAAAQQAAQGSISYQEYPEEASALFRDVEQPILQASLGEQQSLLTPFFGGFRQQGNLPGVYGGAAPIAEASGQRGAKIAGVSSFGQINSAVQGLTPELLSSLSQLVLQRGAQTQGVVPPGFGPFFAPRQVSRQGPPASTKAAPDYFATGASLGGSVGNIGSTLYQDYGNDGG